MVRGPEFVTRLKSLQPSESALASIGFSGASLEQMLRSYECRMLKAVSCSDPLLELCCCYDVSSIEIGYVQFINVPEIYTELVQCGSVETDPIMFRPRSGAVWVVDHSDRNHLIWECAASGGGFLEALLTVAEVSTRRMLGDTGVDSVSAFRHCTRVAGGARYGKFWCMLIGE